MKKRHNFKEDKDLLSALNNISEALKNVVEASNRIATTIERNMSPISKALQYQPAIIPTVKDDQDEDISKERVANNADDLFAIERPETVVRPAQKGKNATVNYDPLANQVQRNKEFREGGHIPRATD